MIQLKSSEQLSIEHWEFIEALLELSENIPLREFLFQEGLKHGYKHGYNDGYADGFHKKFPPSQDALRGVDESDGLSPTSVVMECG